MAHGETYVGQTIRLTDLVTHSDPFIRRCEFLRCNLLGPAVLFLSGSGRISEPVVVVADSVEEAIWEVAPHRAIVVGCIAVEDSSFLECRFEGIGFAGSQAAMDEIRRAVMN